ncbi:MAG: thioredoxin-disulfide reductase [Candidatus Dadabacteria bacterium]|nr:thioredoxin-disulfide reductase [Candidatus Dadabacteria bacterium]
MEIYDVIIIGAGPAGLTAGLYAGRSKLKTLIIDKFLPGGTLIKTEKIEDYPGFEEITGQELAERMEKQTRKFGVNVLTKTVYEVLTEGDMKIVRTDEGDEYRGGAVIVAAGGWPKRLNVPGEKELAGKGVSYCALCDGPFFKNQDIAVVGGGSSAVEEADFLTRFAKKVFIIHRGDKFTAQRISQEKVFKNPKIEILWNSEVMGIGGKEEVEYLLIKNNLGGEGNRLDVAGIFIFIGFVPNNVREHAEHDKLGFIITNERMETSVRGVYAVGDIRAQLVRQVTNATGDGTIAAVMAQRYLEENNLLKSN